MKDRKVLVFGILALLIMLNYFGVIDLLTILNPGPDATYYTNYHWSMDGKELTLSNPTLGGRYYGDFYGGQISKHLWGKYGNDYVNFCYLNKVNPASPGECVEGYDSLDVYENFVSNSECEVEGTLKACFEGEGCFASGPYKSKGKAVIYRGLPACEIDLDSEEFRKYVEEGSVLYDVWWGRKGVIRGWNRLYVSEGTVKFYPKPKIQFYRLENNQCNLIEIFEDERTENDYQTLSECRSKIVVEPEEPPQETEKTEYAETPTITPVLGVLMIALFVIMLLWIYLKFVK